MKKPAYSDLNQEVISLKDQLSREKQLTHTLLEGAVIYKTILEHSLAGIYVIQKGRFQIVSPIAASFTGYDLDELIDRKTSSVIHPDDRKKVRKDALSMLSGKLTTPYAFRIITKQGQIRWVIETVTSTIFRGKPAILGNSMDITVRKAAEGRLMESENLYRTLFETTGTATMVLENDMTVSLVNSEFERMTGYRKEAWEGKKKWTEMVAPEDIPKMKKYHRLRRMDPNTVPRNYEFRLVDSRKRLRDILITVNLIPGTDKSICSDIDLTELKEAERKLKESENLYRAIFATTGTTTVIIENDMTMSLINSEFEKLTGYRKEDWEGKKKWTELIACKEDLDRMKKYHRLRRKDPDAAPRNYEYRMIDQRGRIRNIFLTVDMIPATNKSVASFTDITEIRGAEEELKRKSQKLEDLNTTLTVLLNKRVEDLEEIEHKVVSNVKELVIPYIEIIKNSQMDSKCMSYINVIESNLKEIISPFSDKLSSHYVNLTPRDIQIASFIKEGKTSKEIAQILNLSKSAIDVHRYRLRRKIGLNSQKKNLRDHLTTFK